MDAYLAKVISALNTFKMCFWAKCTEEKVTLHCCSGGTWI